MSGDPAWEASLEAARERLRATPDPVAAGPGPDPEALRLAYLDVLKLLLCDLGGSRTYSAEPQPGGGVALRELPGTWRRIRAAGMDWPLTGLTMVGKVRLDDLQACVEEVVRDGIEGDVLEAGTWRGGASMLARAVLDTLGDDREVWLADSFAGFRPKEDDTADRDVSRYDFLVAHEEEVRDSFARLGLDHGVRFVRGYFDQTLPGLTDRRWALLRLDADTYEATELALRCLYPGLAVGGWLVLDDYGTWEGCRRAVDEFRERHGIADAIVEIDHTGVRWRRTTDAGPEPLPVQPAADAGEPPPYDANQGIGVPTERELELERELAAARGRRAWLRR